MIDIFREFEQKGLRSRMIMQVHDELIFNVVPEELPCVQYIVTRQMQNAYHGRVPLTVSSGVGANGNRALGTGSVGGMLIGMIFQIFIVPALFVAFQLIQEKITPIKWKDTDNEGIESEIEQYSR